MAYQDLLEITNSSDLGHEHLHLSSLNGDESQPAAINSYTTNFIDGDRLSNNETQINKITYLISKNCKVMVLMRGCPGSGKSFQAINILNLCYQNANVDEFIFSADKYFIDKNTGKYSFNSSKLSSAHSWVYNNAKNAVDNNVTPVIIDNTNIQCWEMKSYVQLAVSNGYWIEVIEPDSEWAWDAKKLFNKTIHSVPYDKICLMLQRYDRNITREDLFTKFDLKYSIENMPPKLSSSPRKYQLAENLFNGRKVINTPLTEINDQFKNCISQNYGNTKNNQFTSCNNSKDGGIESLIQEKKSHVVSERKNSSNNILNVYDKDEFISFDEGASKYVNKMVNTYENELLFMNSLNEIPEEEYCSCVRFGKCRDINEGNRKQNIFNLSIGKSDKGTSTDDHTTIIFQPDLSDSIDIPNVLPDIPNSLITKLYEHCKGNVDCIWKLLLDYGYYLSKHQLQNLSQIKKDDVEIENKIGPKHKNHLKKSISKKKKCKTIGENVESKIALDSLGSQVKKNENILDKDNIISDSIRENLISVKDEPKCVQLVVETSVLAQLCDYFHDFSSDLNKNSLMTVQIPEELAKDLYYCLITNVSSQIVNQETIMQDEILARKLQEEVNAQEEYPCKGLNHFSGKISFSAALSKPKLSETYKNVNPKHIMDVYCDTSFKFQDTCNYLDNECGIVSSNSPINQDSPNIVKKKRENIYEVKSNEPSNQNYEQQVIEKSRLRNNCIQKANEPISRKHPAVAGHFLTKAKQCKEHENIAKFKVLEEMFKHKMDLKEIDLHNLCVLEAIHILDLFLDNHILILRKPNGGNCLSEKITIITGRGRHSHNHIARIKPAVLKRISERDIVNFELKDKGLIMVIIGNTSLLTSEII